MIDLTLNVKRVNTEYSSKSQMVEVELNNVDLKELIQAIGEDVLLDEIGEKACISHFDITKSE